MIDFFSAQNSSQNPTLLLVVYTIILSIVLSSALAFTYQKTSKEIKNNRIFMQALILISIVAAMVIQAIGDSVAIGLGMMGALSIIRFRNTVNNPRNIVFIFASLAIGISCGIFGFYIATIGTAGFILTAFVLFFSPLSRSTNMIGSLAIESPLDDISHIEEVLRMNCVKFFRTRFSLGKSEEGKVFSHHYEFRLKPNVPARELNKALENHENIVIKRFNVKDIGESI